MDVVAKHKALSRKLWLDGQYVTSMGEAFPVINPATEEQIGEVAEATPREIEAAIEIAMKAQKDWWARSGAERADIMHEVTQATKRMNAALAESLTREQGKTYKEAMDEIGWCASAMSYYAEVSRQEGGRVHGPSAPGQLHLTMKEPLGNVAAIIPFNYPYLLLFWEVAAAVGAGNAVIIKPSDYTSLSTLLLMEAFAPLPAGLVQCITGKGAAGARLVEHENIHGVAFTGSLKTAQIVSQTCAKTFKPALIEASGHDPFIVMPSTSPRAVSHLPLSSTPDKCAPLPNASSSMKQSTTPLSKGLLARRGRCASAMGSAKSTWDPWSRLASATDTKPFSLAPSSRGQKSFAEAEGPRASTRAGSRTRPCFPA
jgi:betaine-aldehyde dehydrogenase